MNDARALSDPRSLPDPRALHESLLAYHARRPPAAVTPIVEFLDGATVTIPGPLRTVPEGVEIQDSGVYDGEGRLCTLALHRAGNLPKDNVAPETLPKARAAAGETIPGRHLFAGLIGPHFGHFLVESLGRLWALDELAGPFDSLVYIRGHGPGHAPVDSFGRAVLDALAIALPVTSVGAATRFERLVVPSQLFGFHLRHGHPAFHAFVHNRLRGHSGEGPRAKRLYVSRGLIGDIPGEPALEALLTERGFTIIHPETMSFAAQIAAYNGARTILAAEGSAVHVIGLVARGDQKVGVVRRRPGQFVMGMHQLAGFSGRTARLFDGPADLAALTAQLEARGFLR
ncbi:hypothetical protein ATO13_16034 [Stappia sp. 22II-S9-Z10]|nr:hypothetical protein ATO13_16034 [Stappia sp. 22II-S9-Z10]